MLNKKTDSSIRNRHTLLEIRNLNYLKTLSILIHLHSKHLFRVNLQACNGNTSAALYDRQDGQTQQYIALHPGHNPYGFL